MSVYNPSKVVLSLDGGGVRGYFTARILSLIEKELRIDLRKQVDLVVGCSIGSGLVAHLMSPLRQGSLEDLFTPQCINSMMDRSVWDHIMKDLQFQPVFDGTGKKKVLQKTFEELSLRQLHKKVAITAYNVTEARCELFTNYDEESRDYLVADVVDASSATPGFFPGVILSGMEPPSVYVDGGVGASNPILTAFAEAKRLWPDPDQSFRILSIGTGILPTDKDWKSLKVQGWGTIPWFMNGFLDLMLTAPNQHIMQCTARLITSDNKNNMLLHINENIPDIHMDQATSENMTYLKTVAAEAFSKHKRVLKAFFSTGEAGTEPSSATRGLPRKRNMRQESLGSLC